MKKTKKRLLTIVTILVLTLLFLNFKDKINTYFTPKNQSLYPNFDKNQIQQIDFVQENKTTKVYKKNNHWYLQKDKIEYQADEDRIVKVIDSLNSLKIEEIVSTNLKKQQDFGIKTDKLSFQIQGKKYDLYIGKSASMATNYLKSGNQNNIFVASGFDSVFYPEDLRNLNVRFVNQENDITGATIKFENTNLNLEKKNNNWFINNKKVERERIDYFLNDLKTLKAENILQAKDLDMANSTSDLEIKFVENKQEKIAKFYKKDKNRYYLIYKGDNVFEIASTYVESLKKQEKDFLD